jgi:6-phosphofructokinase 1
LTTIKLKTPKVFKTFGLEFQQTFSEVIMTVKRLAVLTSGGDSAGMNPAVRAVVRTALDRGVEVFAIYEGYQGLLEGGDRIRPMRWESVGGMLQKGGTLIGTARSAEFRTREGRRQAAKHLVDLEIDALVVIGGDGSLTGADLFRQEWAGLLKELVEIGQISPELAARHPHLLIVGLVGSIDNDMYGTDMTIGADTALHRITEALDAISSTAASHKRTFVVKVMGRNCGYLALMSAIATGSAWVLIPENPPAEGWEQRLVTDLKAGRQAGRRNNMIIMAEGARDRAGNPIGSTEVSKMLEAGLGEEVRVTVLGHVQRGGSPSAFDRNLGTLMGYAAVDTVLSITPEAEPLVIGMKGNRISRTPLRECLAQNAAVVEAVETKNYDRAMELRSGSFRETWQTLQTLLRALPRDPQVGQKRLRLAVLNCGAPSPGMNTAVRAAVRLGLDRGHLMFGVKNGYRGLADGNLAEMNWMSVNGWAALGGSELGTHREVPTGRDFYAIARAIEKHALDGVLVIGGWAGCQGAYRLWQERNNFPAFNLPIVCMPASIDNNLPGSELSIGADTALNSIVSAVDKIKESAGAVQRCFVVEVMGRFCGYLALMAGLATGAERVYLNEEHLTLRDLQTDLDGLVSGFRAGKRLGVMIRNEHAHKIYDTRFMCALFEEEGHGLFDVRQAILGHLQQGGGPSPFDRILAVRLAARCVDYLIEKAATQSADCAFIGLDGGKIQFHDLDDFTRMTDEVHQRPKKQWWLDLRAIAKIMAQPGPKQGGHVDTIV